MKTYAVLLALVILAFSVPLAHSSTTATPPQLAQLAKQVRALRSQLAAVKVRLACFGNAAKVTSYGVPSSNEGYLYQRPSATPPAPTTFPTTALDFTLQGDKADAYLATVAAKCVTAAATARALPTRRGVRRVPLVPVRGPR
jgi:hypothetical protein